MDMPTTAPVTVTLVGIETVIGTGRCVALAIVDIEVSGIAWQVQGVRVVKRDSGLIVEAPQFRHPRMGRYLPAVVLPVALSSAIGAAVLEAMQGKPPRGA